MYLSSYGCTWEAAIAVEKFETFSASNHATKALLSYSHNFQLHRQMLRMNHFLNSIIFRSISTGFMNSIHYVTGSKPKITCSFIVLELALYILSTS